MREASLESPDYPNVVLCCFVLGDLFGYVVSLFRLASGMDVEISSVHKVRIRISYICPDALSGGRDTLN